MTHEVPTEGEWGPQATFVTDGLGEALALAQAAAGGQGVTLATYLVAMGRRAA